MAGNSGGPTATVTRDPNICQNYEIIENCHADLWVTSTRITR